MKKKIFSTLLISAIMVLPLFTIAQPGPGNGGGGPSLGGGGGAPIGGGLGILLAMGVAYGGKKLYSLYSDDKETLEE